MRFVYVPVGLDSIEGKCIGLLRVCVFVCVFMYTYMHEQVCIFIKQVCIFMLHTCSCIHNKCVYACTLA